MAGHEQLYYASEEFVNVILAFDFSGSFNMVFPRAHHYLFSMYSYISSENFQPCVTPMHIETHVSPLPSL